MVKQSYLLFLTVAASALALIGRGQDRDDPTVFPPDCFDETARYGRPDLFDPLEVLTSDRGRLDYISKTVFGQDSRAALLKYCTNSDTQYLSSLQVGLTNGIGTESRWGLVLGHDDSVSSDTTTCQIREFERDEFRVNSIEIGYLTVGTAEEQGVIWVRFILRNLRNTGPSDTDVIITIGKVETFMMKRTLKFTQANAFVGFHGKVSSGSNDPITQLGVVTFKCREVIEFETEVDERSWRDKVKDFYTEYDILIWIGSGILGCLLICCISCCCYVKCKKRQVKRLQEHNQAIRDQQQEKQAQYKLKSKKGKKKQKSSWDDESGDSRLNATDTQKLSDQIVRQVTRKLSQRSNTLSLSNATYGQPKITIELPEGMATPDLERMGTISVTRGGNNMSRTLPPGTATTNNDEDFVRGQSDQTQPQAHTLPKSVAMQDHVQPAQGTKKQKRRRTTLAKKPSQLTSGLNSGLSRNASPDFIHVGDQLQDIEDNDDDSHFQF